MRAPQRRRHLPPGDTERCTCPKVENHYGKGYACDPGLWVVAEKCPVHGRALRDAIDGQSSLFK